MGTLTSAGIPFDSEGSQDLLETTKLDAAIGHSRLRIDVLARLNRFNLHVLEVAATRRKADFRPLNLDLFKQKLAVCNIFAGRILFEDRPVCGHEDVCAILMYDAVHD